MTKEVRFLVTSIDEEVNIYTEKKLAEMGMSDEDVTNAFGNRAYWMTFTLRDCTFADQQAVTRESVTDKGVPDDTLQVQKRFVRAVEPGTWRTRYANSPDESILPVTEATFIALKPPALGNAIDNAILQSWYPGASRSQDFIRAWQERQRKSDAEKK